MGERHPPSRSAPKRFPQFCFCSFELLAPGRRKVFAGSIDIERQHRHRGAKGLDLRTLLGRVLQRLGDTRRRFLKDILLKILGPFLSWSRAGSKRDRRHNRRKMGVGRSPGGVSADIARSPYTQRVGGAER